MFFTCLTFIFFIFNNFIYTFNTTFKGGEEKGKVQNLFDYLDWAVQNGLGQTGKGFKDDDIKKGYLNPKKLKKPTFVVHLTDGWIEPEPNLPWCKHMFVLCEKYSSDEIVKEYGIVAKLED